MSTVFIGLTELFVDCKYDEHVKAWKWHCFRTGNYFELGRMIVYGRKAVSRQWADQHGFSVV